MAGYGKDDHYPSVRLVDIRGYVNGNLKFAELPEVKIEIPELGFAVPFAQTDVIERLLHGADPVFIERTSQFLSEVAEQLSPIIVDNLIKNSSDERKASETERIRRVLDSVKEIYTSKVVPSLQAVFHREYEKMIALMPRLELIELAEALVNITAIERKATLDDGTVGGPIAGAFVSKLEGFVWIKRKHYFKPDLNPRYFWRKYQRTAKELGQ